MKKDVYYDKLGKGLRTFGKVLKFLLYLFVGLLAVIFFFGEYIFGKDSRISGLFVNYEELLVAIENMLPKLFLTLVVILIILILKKILLKINKTLVLINPRNITIKKLIDNVIQVTAAIVIGIIVLEALGVNVGVLIASAGALSLVIGLGLQSLVKDIVSGTFIILEKSFEVGDMVVINNFKGRVEEIGLRTTKIVAPSGDRFTIANSEITEIINNSVNEAVAACRVGIEYGEDLERVEKIISDNLIEISGRIPSIELVAYKGVSGLLDSSVELLFIAKCKAEDVPQVTRDMNREIKLLFDRNNINIPFPQIVINKRD